MNRPSASLRHGRRFTLGLLILATAIALPSGGLHAQDGPGSYWLKAQGLQSWEWDIDHDMDDFTTRQEYAAGTDPFDPLSKLTLGITPQLPDVVLDWDTVLGAVYELAGSPDMTMFTPILGPIDGDGFNIEVVLSMAQQQAFYCLAALEPVDIDNDGLSAIEEAMIGTNPFVSDTDHDAILDGAEVFTYYTDPLSGDIMVTSGTIRGTTFSDPNGDGDLADGIPVEGAKIFIDANFNGIHDDGERSVLTAADGSYRFILLPPGLYHVRQELPAATVQTVPAPASDAALDTLPDTLIDYTHVAPGVGPLDVPYGFKADDPWPGQDFVINPPVLEEVDPALVLKPIGERDQVPPIGIYDKTEILSIPEDGSVTVGFDEIIVDGPGPDFNIVRAVQGPTTELTDIFVGPDDLNLTLLTTMNQGVGSNTFPVDLSDFPGIAPPIQVIKLVSKVPANPAPAPAGGGIDQGAAIVGFQAINFVGPDTSARVVTIVGSETVEPVDFGRFFEDRPPALFLTAEDDVFQEGMSTDLRLFASDDIGVVSRTLTANGAPVALSADGEASYTPAFPGTVRFEAMATDTAGQVAAEDWLFYVRDTNGDLPFDPSALGDVSGGSATLIQVFSPGAGSVPAADEDIIATIASTSVPIWSVEYAPIALIDPNNLSTPDPDYIALGNDTSFVESAPIGVFPASSLAAGIYFLRITATPSAGGSTKYYGQVIGVGVNEADLRPEITITSPAAGSNADLVQEIAGSITSVQPLTEWFVEYALRSDVDLTNIGSNDPDWTRIADGTTDVVASPLAEFDTTLVPNDAYIVRVVAWNDLRLGRVEAVDVEVTQQAKPGRHHRVFTDLSIDLAGFPLAVKRIYDSYETDTVGDFGHGWSLELTNPDLRETVPQTGVGIFGATAFRDGTRVYVNSPEDPDRRIGFTFKPVMTAGSLFGSVYKATFEPDPGVYETLEIPEGDLGFLQIDPSGDVILVFLPLPFNPDRYILTTPKGNRYTLDQGAGFIEAEDPNGNRLSYTASEGFTHSSGQKLEFTRDGLGRITHIVDPEGDTWLYGYDAEGNLETVTNPDSELTTYGYFTSPAHYLETVTDPYGRIGTQYKYDADGRLCAIVDENGERFEQLFDPGSFTGSFTDRRGNVTQVIYDSRGNVTTTTGPAPEFEVTTFVYGDPANPDLETSVTDPLGLTTTYEYDSRGNRTKVFVDGSFFDNWEFTYNEFSQVTEIDGPGPYHSNYEYDAKGNMTRYTDRRGFDATFTRTPEGRVASQTIAGVTDYFTYDPGTGAPASITSSTGPTVHLTYDGRDNLTEVVDAFGELFQFETDASGTPVSVTDPDGNMATTVKNPDGTWTSTDLNGMTVTRLLDAAGRVRSTTMPDGFVNAPDYDEADNLTGLTDPNGNTRAYTYDALNRMDSRMDALTNTTTYDYDGRGRIIEIIDRLGKKRTFDYNEFDVVTVERWHDGGGAVVREFIFTYAASPLNLGRLDSVTDGSSTWTFTNGPTRPSRITYAFAGQSPVDVNYSWSTAANVVPTEIKLFDQADVFQDGEIETRYNGAQPVEYRWSTPDGDGRHIRMRYDAMSRIERIERFDVALTSSLSTLPFANTLFTFDKNNRIQSINHEDAAGTLLFPESSLQYGRSPGGMINDITQPTNTATYSYDVLGQVTGAAHTAFPSESYTYDPAGNRLTSHLFAGSATIGTANRPSVVGDLTLTWDAEGNLATETNTATGDLREFFYDHRNQLTRVDSTPNGMATATVASFEYDFANRLMNRTVAGTKTWIVHDRAMPIAEFVDGDSDFSAMFFYAPDQVDGFFGVWRRGIGERWFLNDHLGSVRGVVDETAAPIAWVDYDSFGKPLGAVAGLDSVRYAGRLWNEGAMLYENRFRAYSPSLGRFIQEDPVDYRAGDLNFYRYASNNPLTATDPFGTIALLEYGTTIDVIDVILTSNSLLNLAICIRDILQGIAEVIGGGSGGGGGGAACIVDNFPIPLGPLGGPPFQGIDPFPNNAPDLGFDPIPKLPPILPKFPKAP